MLQQSESTKQTKLNSIKEKHKSLIVYPIKLSQVLHTSNHTLYTQLWYSGERWEFYWLLNHLQLLSL